MNRKLALLILPAALLAGWGIGRLVSPGSGSVKQGDIAKSEVGLKTPLVEGNQSSDSDNLTRKVDDLFEKIRKVGGEEGDMVEMYQFAETLSLEEFGPAIALLSAGKGISSGPNVATYLAGYWMELDPTNAKAWFESLSPEVQDEFKHGIMDTWSKMAPGEMLTWLENQPEHRLNKMFEWGAPYYTQFNPSMGKAEFEQSLALMVKLSPKDRENLPVMNHFQAYAKKFPAEAAAYALSLPGGSLRSEATIGVARAWAIKDPEGARKWVEGIGDPSLTALVLPACAEVIAQKNPKGAAEWVASLPDSLRNQNALQNVLNQWALNDSKEALDWVGGFPEGTNVDKYLVGIFKGMEEADPELAMATILERAEKGLPIGEGGYVNPNHGPYADYARMKGATEGLKIAGSIPEKGGRKLDMIYSTFVVNAAQENFTETSQWVLAQKSGVRKSEAVRSLSSALFMRNRDEAVKWTEALPKSPDSDKARLNVAGNIFRTDPAAATKMYLDMADANLGRLNLKTNMQQWMKADRKAAEAWLNKTNSFSDAEKAEVLKNGGAR